jgi:hypothetical protein
LEATSTPRVGVMATMSRGSRARARATVTFCWFPPDNSPEIWPRPAETIDSRRASGAAAAARADGRRNPAIRASQSVMVMVAFSATLSAATNPSAWRSSGM